MPSKAENQKMPKKKSPMEDKALAKKKPRFEKKLLKEASWSENIQTLSSRDTDEIFDLCVQLELWQQIRNELSFQLWFHVTKVSQANYCGSWHVAACGW